LRIGWRSFPDFLQADISHLTGPVLCI
jgi:hypothetical protein